MLSEIFLVNWFYVCLKIIDIMNYILCYKCYYKTTNQFKDIGISVWLKIDKLSIYFDKALYILFWIIYLDFFLLKDRCTLYFDNLGLGFYLYCQCTYIALT